jgi:hypothetical protein
MSPVDEGALGVHEVELVVEVGQDLGDGRGVGDHADGAHDLGKVVARHDCGGLVVDADLEAARGPVDELDQVLALKKRKTNRERQDWTRHKREREV